jgi:hypothetical protein
MFWKNCNILKIKFLLEKNFLFILQFFLAQFKLAFHDFSNKSKITYGNINILSTLLKLFIKIMEEKEEDHNTKLSFAKNIAKQTFNVISQIFSLKMLAIVVCELKGHEEPYFDPNIASKEKEKTNIIQLIAEIYKGSGEIQKINQYNTLNNKAWTNQEKTKIIQLTGSGDIQKMNQYIALILANLELREVYGFIEDKGLINYGLEGLKKKLKESKKIEKKKKKNTKQEEKIKKTMEDLEKESIEIGKFFPKQETHLDFFELTNPILNSNEETKSTVDFEKTNVISVITDFKVEEKSFTQEELIKLLNRNFLKVDFDRE